MTFNIQRKGKGGKTVTKVFGLQDLDLPEQMELCTAAKNALGCGAPFLDGILEIQGDQRDRAAKWLLSDANLAKLAKAEAKVLAEYYGMIVDNPFTDVPEGKWYTDDVLLAYKRGLMTGTTDTTFSPNERPTRAQIAVVANRIVDYIQKGGG